MNKDEKIIRAKVGLLDLAKQLGNASHEQNVLGARLASQVLAAASPSARPAD